jgi:hypothetical protein
MKSFKQFFYEEDNNLITVYRGESVHNRKGGPMGGKFYSLDHEFANKKRFEAGMYDIGRTRKGKKRGPYKKKETTP